MYRDQGVHAKGGVITELDPDLVTVRVQLPAGNLPPDPMRGPATIAKRYGRGIVHLTARQTVEIPHVDPNRLKNIGAALAKNGTPVGSERDEIVNIIACPGIERCKFGNVDTIELAKKLDAKHFGKEMPVKIRVSISGCPNSCTGPMLNEIGIMGRIEPVRTPGLCTGCGTCAEYCKERAISIKNGISVLDKEKCIQCGVCIRSCPYQLLKSQHRHYLVTVGGRRGRHPRVGRELARVDTEDEVVALVERISSWVYRRAWSGRLLSEQLDDIKFDQFKDEVVSAIAAGTASGSPR